MYTAFGKTDLTHVVLPVPRGPKRKKLLRCGGCINLEYIIPFYIYLWSCQGKFTDSPVERLTPGKDAGDRPLLRNFFSPPHPSPSPARGEGREGVKSKFLPRITFKSIRTKSD